ncbi:MAG: 16S rRNA (cytosine(1402)-N(4))-methyltransferase, partial [Candidatus Blackburnbacteria bacterium]|nr:16S rRNA (cytosine(1402)-N(4))-methyltransferase [Candidatus Blackburnbacteria bacterium]
MVEHRPVMLTEVLYFLDVGPGKRFIDATLGGGGHTEAILQSGGEVLGIEQDPK